MQETNARKEVGLILVNLGQSRCLQDVSRKQLATAHPEASIKMTGR